MSHMPIVMNCSGHIELRTVSDMCHSFQQMYFEIIDLTPLSFTTQLRHHFLLEDSWDRSTYNGQHSIKNYEIYIYTQRQEKNLLSKDKVIHRTKPRGDPDRELKLL